MAIGFLERSRIERSVLNLVNESFSSHRLSGLSESAVTRWSKKIESEGLPTKAEAAKKLLLEISHRIRSNSDASKHVFAGEKLITNGTTEICIDQLRKILAH